MRLAHCKSHSLYTSHLTLAFSKPLRFRGPHEIIVRRREIRTSWVGGLESIYGLNREEIQNRMQVKETDQTLTNAQNIPSVTNDAWSVKCQVDAICNEQVASTILSVQIDYCFLETNVKKYLYIDFRARALFNFNFYRLYTWHFTHRSRYTPYPISNRQYPIANMFVYSPEYYSGIRRKILQATSDAAHVAQMLRRCYAKVTHCSLFSIEELSQSDWGFLSPIAHSQYLIASSPPRL